MRLPLTEWCEGFLTGHDWLSEVWAGFGFDIDEVAEEEPESELQQELWAILSVITTLADVDLALEGAEEPEELRASLPVLVEKVFPNAVEQYALIGRQLGEMAANEVEEPYIAPPKIGRNDPCPCGSGKKYKKCCGA